MTDPSGERHTNEQPNAGDPYIETGELGQGTPLSNLVDIALSDEPSAEWAARTMAQEVRRLREREPEGEQPSRFMTILREIAQERRRQDEKWGTISEIARERDPDRTPNDWLAILAEEFGELSLTCVEERAYRRQGDETLAANYRVRMRREAIQTAAVAASFVAWLDYMEKMERAGRALMASDPPERGDAARTALEDGE